MELILQRYSWALNLFAVLVGAYLAARTVNTLAATAIAPKPALLQQAAAPQATPVLQRAELDPDKVAKLFDVPLPKASPAGEASAAEPVRGGWNPVPTPSSLHGTLVG